MERIPEPELMDGEAQARAYAEADFDEPHAMFVRLWDETFGNDELSGTVIDLGCGPADITARFAKRFPGIRVDAVDGSRAMLAHARTRLRREDLEQRIRLIFGRLPQVPLRPHAYHAVISNSLLHHLTDPAVLWDTIRSCARPGAPVLVMDLMRPDSEEIARDLVAEYANDAPEILRHDFYNSLRAAYRPDEVRTQLENAGLGYFAANIASDRHLIVTGRTR